MMQYNIMVIMQTKIEKKEGTMTREFNYEDITIRNIEDNEHFIFICDGDKKIVILESENENEHK